VKFSHATILVQLAFDLRKHCFYIAIVAVLEAVGPARGCYNFIIFRTENGRAVLYVLLCMQL
jgi:hypothetical protein